MSSRDILEDQRFSYVGIDGYTVPNCGRFFKLRSYGGNQNKAIPLEPHPYYLNLDDSYTAPYDSWDCNTGNSPYASSSKILPGGQLFHSWTEQDDYALYANLERKYDKGEFNAGIFSGELGKTADMLADRTAQLFRALRAAKKGNFAHAADLLSRGAAKRNKSTGKRPEDGRGKQDPLQVSAGWLELQYGWKPLLLDIESLADQIAQLDKPRKRRITARRKIHYLPNQNNAFEITGYGRYSKQIVAYITEDIPSWPEALGLADPELVAWELVPFSFVVDWFIPIGNWLQARAFAQRAKGQFVLTTCDMYNFRCTEAKQLCLTSAKPGKNRLHGAAWNRHVMVNRTIASSLPAVPLPTFYNGIDRGNRLLNAIALIGSLFGPKNFFGR